MSGLMGDSLPLAPGMQGTSACGCCDGAGAETPAEVWNRAGLPAVGYRIGTHGGFKAGMLARLSAAAYPSLHRLTSRDDSDPTIALLDATAAVADVLTFYAERIANESFLRTATEWRSLAAMGRLTGYEPSPGVAATAYLAFTLEDAAGAPEQTTVPGGTAVQSIPVANTLPQTFETLADFTGRPEWNAMAAVTTQPPPVPDADMATLLAAGIATGVRPGDRLVLTGPGTGTGTSGPWVRIVAAVTPDATARTTRIDLQPQPPPWPPAPRPPRTVPATFDLVTKRLNGGTLNQAIFAQNNDGAVLAQRWDGADLLAYLRSKRWSRGELMAGVMHAAAQPQPRPAGLAATPGAFRFRQRAAVFGHNAPAWNTLPPTMRQAGPVPQVATVSGVVVAPGQVVGTLSNVTLAGATALGVPLAGQAGTAIGGQLLGGIVVGGTVVPNAAPAAPYPLDWDANAATLDHAWRQNAPVTDGNGFPVTDNHVVQLDHAVAGIAPGSVAVLEDGPVQAAFAVTGAGDRSAVAFSMTAKVTELDLGPGAALGGFSRRGTTVFCDSEALVLAPLPVTDPVGGGTIVLDRIYLGLAAGQPVAVSGPRADLPGVAGAEIATLASVAVIGNTTVLTLAAALEHTYEVRSVRVCGNVVPATHGATVAAETLGSGDATLPFQSFALRQPGLTFVADPTTGGTRTTLGVRVNGEAWAEVPSLYGAGPDDRVYATWLDETGRTRVVFGDGVSGARLPTGAGNVVAAYRSGTGSAGLVDAGAVSLPLVRPLGVRGVSNPVPTTDAADPDSPDMLRTAAPLHVLTLDRVVSLPDYRDYALAYPGITKAVASWQVGVRSRGVLLTVAGPGGAAVRADGPLARSLVAALRAAGDPKVGVALGSFAPVFFQVAAELTIDPALSRGTVTAAVQDALQAAFALDRRTIGQPVWESEVVAAIQSVRGVVACQLTLFHRLDGVMQPGVYPVLTAAVPPTPGSAELLLLDPRPIGFGAFP